MSTAESIKHVSLPGIGRVAYAVGGSGPPLLLLHGLGATHAIWQPTVEGLASRYTIYAPDLPGHGGSAKPDGPYTLDVGLRFTIAFMDALDIPKAVLIGSSMGGLLALATAVRHPERTTALALFSPAGLSRAICRPMRLASAPIIGPLLVVIDARFGGGFLPRLFYQPDKVDPAMIAEINKMAAAPGVQSTALNIIRHGVNLRGLKSSLVQAEGFRKLTCPILVVWGQEDRIIPVVNARIAAQAQHRAQVHVFPECGHLPHIEKAQDCNGLLSTFLQQVYASAPLSQPAPALGQDHRNP